MRRHLKWERLYPHPPERVWRALTESQALAAWLMENDFAPRVGHRFQFRTRPGPGFNGLINCEVLEVLKPVRLSYTWNSSATEAVLTFTLQAEEGATRLRVEMSGFIDRQAVVAERFALQINCLLGSSRYERALPDLLKRMMADPFGHVWVLHDRRQRVALYA